MPNDVLSDFLIGIDSITPQVPIEQHRVTVKFTLTHLWRRHPDAVSGKVTTSLGYPEVQVTNLEYGFESAFHGSFEFTAPGAGKYQLLLYFTLDGRVPHYTVGNRPGTAMDVAARYVVSLESIDITDTRSVNEDTDYASLSAGVEHQAEMNYHAYCAAGPDYPRIPNDLVEEMERLRGVDEPHMEARAKQIGVRPREGNAVYNYLSELVQRDM